MPRGVYDRPEPDTGMVERSLDKGGISIAPDKETLKDYIRRRLEEGHMSIYLLAKNIGTQRGSVSSRLQPGISVSYEFLSRLLWIVDGDRCPFEYGRVNEVRGGMTAPDFIERHPDAFIVDYLQDQWKITLDGKVYAYNKVDWSLVDALADLDRKI